MGLIHVARTWHAFCGEPEPRPLASIMKGLSKIRCCIFGMLRHAPSGNPTYTAATPDPVGGKRIYQ
jgi:hypothetical protein